MFDSLKMLAPFFGLVKDLFNKGSKFTAIKDRVIAEGYNMKAENIKSLNDFVPSIEGILKDFFPHKDITATLKEALVHPEVKRLQSMPLEEAQRNAGSIALKLLSENKDSISSMVGRIK